MKRFKLIIFYTIFLFLLFFFTISLIEIIFRIIPNPLPVYVKTEMGIGSGIGKYAAGLKSLKIRHPILWLALKPNYRIHLKGHPEYSFSVYTTNSSIFDIGFRKNKTDYIGKNQIAVIGDSFVFGTGVEYEDTFVYQLEKKINTRCNNFGVNGYGVCEYRIIYEKYALKSLPKLTIIAFFENDYKNCYAFIKRKKNIFYRADLRLKNIFITYNLVKYYMPYYKLKPIYYKLRLKDFSEVLNINFTINDIKVPYVNKGKDIALKELRKIISLSQKRKNKILFVFIPSKEKTYIEMVKDDKIKNRYIDPYGPIIELLKKNKQEYIYPFLEFKKHSFEKLFFTGDGHFTPVGHRLMAEIIYKKIKRDRLLNVKE